MSTYVHMFDAFYFVLPSILVFWFTVQFISGLQNFIFNLLLSVVMILTIVDNFMIINYLLIFMIQLFN